MFIRGHRVEQSCSRGFQASCTSGLAHSLESCIPFRVGSDVTLWGGVTLRPGSKGYDLALPFY